MSDAERQRNVDFIIYYGQGSIPKDATGIRVHPAVRVIPEWAFDQCLALTNAELPERLEELGEGAFRQCTSLRAIIIPKLSFASERA